MIDLAAELRAALCAVGLTPSELRDLVRAEVRAALEEKERDALIDRHALAVLLGCSPDACKARIARDRELRGLALQHGSRLRWRKAEVLRLLEARRTKPEQGNAREGK